MRGLVRLLMIFGPMIMSQVQRYQRNKARNQRRPSERSGKPRYLPEKKKRKYIKYKEVKQTPTISEEDKNAALTDDEIMLTKEDLRHAKVGATSQQDKPPRDTKVPLPDLPPIKEEKLEDELNLRDIFLKEKSINKKA